MKPTAKHLTIERLKEVISYDPDSGVFVWKVMLSRVNKVGGHAGCVLRDGYRVISVDYEIFLAHRLAWFYMTGRWPSFQIDHIDGERDHNGFSNLRDVPPFVNCQNVRTARRDNKASGLLGVSRSTKKLANGERSKRWVARIGLPYKRIYLGSFTSSVAAHEAYITAKRKYHTGSTL